MLKNKMFIVSIHVLLFSALNGSHNFKGEIFVNCKKLNEFIFTDCCMFIKLIVICLQYQSRY